jgi:hypothetical protein
MATEGDQSWRKRSDPAAQKKGVGVLIDTEYLASENEDRRRNPYYIVVDDVRYYGSTPDAAVEAARDDPAVKGSVRGEAIFKAQKQVSTALPSNANRGRTKKNNAPKANAPAKKGYLNRTRNALGKVAKNIGNRFSRKPKGQKPLNGANPPPAPAPAAPAPAAAEPPAPTSSEKNTTPLLSEEGLAA